MTRWPERNLILGVGAASAATLFFTVTLVRALTVEPPTAHRSSAVTDVATPPPATDAGDPPAASSSEGVRSDVHPPSRGAAEAAAETPPPSAEAPPAERPRLTRAALMLAVDNDPFRPDRQRPPERYLLPGERRTEAPPPEPPPPPPFRIVGTAVTATGGLALVQLEDAAPRLLAVGESLLGYTLENVDGESATMVGQARTLQLPVMRMLALDQERQPQGRAGRGQQGGGRGGRAQNQRELEAIGARQQEVMELLRQRLGERGGDGNAVMFENGRVIIRPRINTDTMEAPAPRAPRN